MPKLSFGLQGNRSAKVVIWIISSAFSFYLPYAPPSPMALLEPPSRLLELPGDATLPLRTIQVSAVTQPVWRVYRLMPIANALIIGTKQGHTRPRVTLQQGIYSVAKKFVKGVGNRKIIKCTSYMLLLVDHIRTCRACC